MSIFPVVFFSMAIFTRLDGAESVRFLTDFTQHAILIFDLHLQTFKILHEKQLESRVGQSVIKWDLLILLQETVKIFQCFGPFLRVSGWRPPCPQVLELWESSPSCALAFCKKNSSLACCLFGKVSEFTLCCCTLTKKELVQNIVNLFYNSSIAKKNWSAI